MSHLKNQEIADKYKVLVENKLQSVKSTSNQNTWNKICEVCISSSEELKPRLTKKGNPYNEHIDTLSQHQKSLRLKINSEKDPEKRDQLKKLRNKTLKSIKNILQKEEEDKLNDKISEINNSKDDSRRMFKAVREIKRLSDTNIYVQDKQGNNIGNTENKIKIITEHFTSVFQYENAIPLPDYQKRH